MVIQRHLTRAHKLRAIHQMIAEDPGIMPDLLEILSNPASVPAGPVPVQASETRRRVDAKTQAEKVVAYFHSRGNTMATVRQIAEGTGLSRGVINALLYNSSQKGLFKKLTVGGKKRKFWRLKEDDHDTDGEVSADDLAEMGIEESDLDGGSEDADEPDE